MRWWYFIREVNVIKLAPLSFFTYRPEDATKSDNPMTPWYDLYDHIDRVHIHLVAESYDKAYQKALKMIDEEERLIHNTK